MSIHPDQITISEDLVRALVDAQFSAWAALPLKPGPSTGTDHAIFRLGDDLAVRMPLRPSAVVQVEKEQVWLPQIAAALSVRVPTPIAKGQPGADYPFCWTICKWLEGQNPLIAAGASATLGAELGEFVSTLHRLDAAGGPTPGDHNFGRGVPLADRDVATRTAIDQSSDLIDTVAVEAAWNMLCVKGKVSSKSVWVHGDLSPSNILVKGSRLVGVLDFGGLAVGDAACDLIIAWNFLSGAGRSAFRKSVPVDGATWERGKAWALSIAAIQLPYYRTTMPNLASNALHTIEQVMSDPFSR